METDGDSWVFRREPRIKEPIASLGRVTESGIPYLSPQIQLLYKADHLDIERNNLDFKSTLPLLNHYKASWLVKCLERRYPGHEWIAPLNQRIGDEKQT